MLLLFVKDGTVGRKLGFFFSVERQWMLILKFFVCVFLSMHFHLSKVKKFEEKTTKVQ